jgi:hypothetical protein
MWKRRRGGEQVPPTGITPGGTHCKEDAKMTIRQRLEHDADELRALRDEIEVQMHLGKLDAQDHWNDLEKRWEHAERKLKQLGNAGREAAEDITEATRIVLDEIRSGYEKLKATLE